MKNIKYITLIFACCFAFTAMAQKPDMKKKSTGFFSANSIGFLEGEAHSSFTIQSVNGWRFGKFASGIGIGVDHYAVRSIPLFVEASQTIVDKKNSVFLYADGGTHFSWKMSGQEYSVISTAKNPQLYYETGLGYNVPLRSTAIQFRAGYSFKSYQWSESQQIYCINFPCPDQVNHFTVKLTRLALRAGIVF